MVNLGDVIPISVRLQGSDYPLPEGWPILLIFLKLGYHPI